MLKLEQSELGEISGVSLETIRRLERMDGPLVANSRTLISLQAALERDEVVFSFRKTADWLG